MKPNYLNINPKEKMEICKKEYSHGDPVNYEGGLVFIHSFDEKSSTRNNYRYRIVRQNVAVDKVVDCKDLKPWANFA